MRFTMPGKTRFNITEPSCVQRVVPFLLVRSSAQSSIASCLYFA